MKRGSVWLSMTVLFAGYTLLYTGYVWLRGYQISFGQIIDPVNFYKGSWPPPPAAGGTIVPSASSASAT